jgi:hypothetical protein
MPAKVFGTYCSSMDALELNFELWLPWPSTRQDGCRKQFKLDLRSCCSKFTTLCHFSFVSLSCKYDEDCMKGTFFGHDHRLLNHARLSQVKIVK